MNFLRIFSLSLLISSIQPIHAIGWLEENIFTFAQRKQEKADWIKNLFYMIEGKSANDWHQWETWMWNGEFSGGFDNHKTKEKFSFESSFKNKTKEEVFLYFKENLEYNLLNPSIKIIFSDEEDLIWEAVNSINRKEHFIGRITNPKGNIIYDLMYSKCPGTYSEEERELVIQKLNSVDFKAKAQK